MCANTRSSYAERAPEHPGHHVAGQVVVGGTEPAGHQNQVGPLEGVHEHGAKLRRVVSHDRLGLYLDPDVVETLGNEE